MPTTIYALTLPFISSCRRRRFTSICLSFSLFLSSLPTRDVELKAKANTNISNNSSAPHGYLLSTASACPPMSAASHASWPRTQANGSTVRSSAWTAEHTDRWMEEGVSHCIFFLYLTCISRPHTFSFTRHIIFPNQFRDPFLYLFLFPSISLCLL